MGRKTSLLPLSSPLQILVMNARYVTARATNPVESSNNYLKVGFPRALLLSESTAGTEFE